MSYYGWAPYVSVAERRKKAEKVAAKAKKSGAILSPIESYRGAIAKTFWGKAWCDNLETYSDYANRLPRGRTYVRNGSVIDLVITEGQVQAQVMGSSLYKVVVKVQPVPTPQWQAIGKDCSSSIDSLVELLQGKLSTAVMQRICTPRTGLFPSPREISFNCSCPDSASMCKHVAAVFYGVGARLDQQPELLFRLRKVDPKDLVNCAATGLPTTNTGPAAGKVLDDSMLADVFGIEMDDDVALKPKPKPKKSVVPATKTATKAIRQKTAITAEIGDKPVFGQALVAAKKVASTKVRPPAKKTGTTKSPVAAPQLTTKAPVKPSQSQAVDAANATIKAAVPKKSAVKKTPA